MRLRKAAHRDGDRWRVTLVLSDGKQRHIYLPSEEDAQALSRGIELATSATLPAGAHEVVINRPPKDPQEAAVWWRDTLLSRAYDCAVRGDDNKLAQLSRSAVGFENIAKMKALVTKLMAHIEKLQAGSA